MMRTLSYAEGASNVPQPVWLASLKRRAMRRLQPKSIAKGIKWAVPLLWVLAASAMLACVVNGAVTSRLPIPRQPANTASEVIADGRPTCTWIGAYCAFPDR
jgi:hypothetical protein